MNQEYDVIIIGGGPAGLSAGIYTSRGRLKSLLIEKMAIGGSVVYAGMVENYPGFSQGVSGLDLTDQMNQQATRFGMETAIAEVTGVTLKDNFKSVATSQGDYTAKAVIIAGGTERQKLNVPGEQEFTGRGVSFCALCDGAFFQDKVVAVVGGGNTAVSEALELTGFASKVFLIHRRKELRATPILQERITDAPKVEFLWDTVVDAIEGDEAVRRLKLTNVTTNKKSTLPVDGIFVATGTRPTSDYLKGIVALDANGAIPVNDKMETNVSGIFAAGDIRSGSIRQVVGAVGDGAIAAVNAERYIKEHFKK